jgi:predicted transcriptional regulator
MLQKKMVPLDEYNNVVRQLLLDKTISLDTSHLLSLLYTQVQDPVIALAKLIKQNLAMTQQTMHSQITNWVKTGLLKQEDDEYIMSLSQGADGVKVNGKLMTPAR